MMMNQLITASAWSVLSVISPIKFLINIIPSNIITPAIQEKPSLNMAAIGKIKTRPVRHEIFVN
jgi:hypothetical protein